MDFGIFVLGEERRRRRLKKNKNKNGRRELVGCGMIVGCGRAGENPRR
jgi:hypothetical protein